MKNNKNIFPPSFLSYIGDKFIEIYQSPQIRSKSYLKKKTNHTKLDYLSS